jgi:hypothetical protein
MQVLQQWWHFIAQQLRSHRGRCVVLCKLQTEESSAIMMRAHGLLRCVDC